LIVTRVSRTLEASPQIAATLRKEAIMFRRVPTLSALLLAGIASLVSPVLSAQSSSSEKLDESAFEKIVEATRSVVQVRAKAIENARTSKTLGSEREGAGVVIAPGGLIVTIGYLILEADSVEVVDHAGKAVPANVVAYDHATGFGLLRASAALNAKPVTLGKSSDLTAMQRVLIASGATEDNVSMAYVTVQRPFSGYWEYSIDKAIFTSPPRTDHSGAALISRDGELVGIGSLVVADAGIPGARLPGNMFVPVDLLKPVLDELMKTGRTKAGIKPWIGINSAEEDGRVKIIRLTEDGPAENAGLKVGDLILAVGGQKVTGLDELYKRIWSAGAPGTTIALTVLQGVEVKQIAVKSMDRMEFLRKRPAI
jgi:serine protease Do